MSVTVCMASYNGSKYIHSQLESILSQLSVNDEVIIIDDSSTDSTVEVIKSFNDKRIKLFINKDNKGEVFSFNKAILLAKNDHIFLSDQDDIWLPGRVEVMRNALVNSGAFLLTSNFKWIDSYDNPIDIDFDGVASKDSTNHLKNILDIFIGKTNYFGCAMAFNKMFIRIITPIPSFTESHDLWMALASNIIKSNVHIDDITFLKRKHGDNVTSTVSSRPLIQKIFSRIIFLISIFVILKRKLYNRN